MQAQSGDDANRRGAPQRLLIFIMTGGFEVNVTDMSPRTTPNEAVSTVDETIASIIPLPRPQKAKTGAYRQRKRKKGKAAVSSNDDSPSSELLIREGFCSADSA